MKKGIDWFTIVLSDTTAGGTEHQQLQLFTHLVKTGNRCHVICLSKRYTSNWDFVKTNGDITYFPFSKRYINLNFLLLYPYLFYYFIKTKPIISFSSQTFINATIGFYKKMGLLDGVKLVVRESNSIFELMRGLKLKTYELAYKIGYSAVDLVICQTDVMKDQLIRGIPDLGKRLKICVIENPIDLNFIDDKSNVIFSRYLSDSYIVAAGSLHPKKGFDFLIDVFQLVLTEFSELKLVILGEGKERVNLTEKIISLNLQDKIILEGFVENVYPYFKNAQACVISSRVEGFPNVLLQMMSQNTKIISTLSAGSIKDIPGIYTAPVNDTHAFYKGIIKAIKTDTTNNRVTFDKILERRSVSNFVAEIMANLK